MSTVKLDDGFLRNDSVSNILDSAVGPGEGLLRPTPTGVPHSFLRPGRPIKLIPADLYAFGADRSGINKRWIGSTTETAIRDMEIENTESEPLVALRHFGEATHSSMPKKDRWKDHQA